MPDIPETLAAAFAAAAALAEGASRPWWLIGGAAALLHGLHTEPADVDLLTDVEAARAILGRAGVPARAGSPSPLFRSTVFGSVPAGGLRIEVMGGLSLRTEVGWEPIALATREHVRLGGATLWIPARTELIALLRRFGRPKDLARAALLEALPRG